MRECTVQRSAVLPLREFRFEKQDAARIRDGSKAHRTAVGRNQREAERALRKLSVAVDEGQYVPQRRIAFVAWADQWITSVEVGANTIRSYEATVVYAKAAFGSKDVRRLGPDDVKRMNATMADAGLSGTTRAKHLRVLHACLASAIASGYAGSNPVALVPKGERPKPTKREAPYFTDDELPRLFAQLEPGVYRNLCLVALKTGMRLGELSALTWGDCDLVGGVVQSAAPTRMATWAFRRAESGARSIFRPMSWNCSADGGANSKAPETTRSFSLARPRPAT